MKTAQEKQGYRVKTAQPACGNCKFRTSEDNPEWRQDCHDICEIGGFIVEKHLGYCKLHEFGEKKWYEILPLTKKDA